jgi:hypothetical protein
VVASAVVAMAWLAVVSTAGAQPAAKAKTSARYAPTADERARIGSETKALADAVAALAGSATPDDRADVEVFHRAAVRALRPGGMFDRKDVAAALRLLERGRERARQLARGARPWAEARGPVARGFVSGVDGSVQPYAVVVPEGLELRRDRPARLDVVLHGRNATLSEVRFLAAHDGKPAPAGSEGKITLHVFGRGNNAYRWAGETDVFEAIDAVRRNYPIDDRRVVLRGFSMGGAGAWHLGLHHPGRWASVEAGAGFTETKTYAKLGDIPEVQQKALHIYDAVDYALNAYDVPIAGYGGEIDPQLRASTNIVEALKSLGFSLRTEGLVTRGEDLDFLRLVGPQTAHKVEPASARRLSAFHDAHAGAGADRDPKRLRFATYTLKYPKVAWLTVGRLTEHYRRAEVDAEIEDRRVVVHRAENVNVLGLDRRIGDRAVIEGRELPLGRAAGGDSQIVYFQRSDGSWRVMDDDKSRVFEANAERGKRHGLQGPIDDAFTGPFLCVRGSGTPWSPAVARWADARLERFRDDWANYLHGEVRIKADTEVTPADVASYNLILFGDPGSNRLIADVLDGLPLAWTRASVTLAGQTYAAADHAPALIAPNPKNPRRYVVVNSGHTFGAADFEGTNARLFPRLGDFAVFRIDDRDATPLASGYFDEGWSLGVEK